MSHFKEIEQTFQRAKEEQRKFWEQNNAAAPYRKILKELEKLAHSELSKVRRRKKTSAHQYSAA
jgi:vacuolar-type H+-ATPase subunit H